MTTITATLQENLPSRTNLHDHTSIDENYYHCTVLSLATDITEADLDEALAQEAKELGVMPAQSPDIDGIASSLSGTTISSDSNHKGSIISQLTAPTSCSSSERPPPTRSSTLSDGSPPTSNAPSLLSDISKRRETGFRKGIRKMTTFRKRRPLAPAPCTKTSNNLDEVNTLNSDQFSIKSGLKSPAASIRSRKSSWSNLPSMAKLNYDPPILSDPEAVHRSSECEEMQKLHSRQLEERLRFLNYQRTLLSQLRSQHQIIKQDKKDTHQKVIDQATERVGQHLYSFGRLLTSSQNLKLVEDLEARQLEEEMKLVKEFEVEKRAVMVRLRHMEAYCHSPTPPPTPIDRESGRLSVEEPLPERKVTDRDYHNLAQQYRERDAMDQLHAAKINVLRGKQKKAVEKFMIKKENEIEIMEKQHDRQIANLDQEAAKEEDAIRAAFEVRRARLESRWRLQALIERMKQEKLTGLKYAPLPDVVAIGGPETVEL